jgi:formylglycine-generating enzyme required for sulfatase activity
MKPIYLVFGVCAIVAFSLECSKNPVAQKSLNIPQLPTLTMVSIPAGTFKMGSTIPGFNAAPVHSVTLSSFTMSSTLITQEQYQTVMGGNPSNLSLGGTSPVESVNWYDAVLFCNALSKLAGKDTVYKYNGSDSGIHFGVAFDSLASVVIDYTKGGFRLPTEAEYEYACRAGTTTDYYWGRNFPPTTLADTIAIDSNAVWIRNSPDGTQPVATKKPNAWGLYDMTGNLSAWCNDWFGKYSADAQTNPTGASTGYARVYHAGCWRESYESAAVCLCSWNFSNDCFSWGRENFLGFRVVCGAH